jgi:putative hydrolase of HD superfamily
MNDLKVLIEFIKLTHEIRNVRRAVLLETDVRKENDSEHMYQLALTAWFLIEKDKLKLDKQRVIGLALVHDIVEIYAGDIPTYAPEHSHPDRAINERLAAARLQKEWPSFKSMHELIVDYEKKESPEAKFVYALDKLMPVINNYLYHGRIWKKVGLDLEWLKSSKAGKIEASNDIYRYYQHMLKILENQPELFESAERVKP